MTFGIIAMVLVGCSWTVCGYIMGNAPKHNIDSKLLLFFGALLSFVLSFSYGIATMQGITSYTGYIFCFAVLVFSGIFNFFQLDVMSLAMQRGPNGVIWTITQAGFILPFLMGIVFFDVKLSWYMVIGFASILISLVFFGMTQSNSGQGKWKLLVSIAFLMAGLGQCFSNIPSYYAETNAVSGAFRTAFWSIGMMIGAILANIKKIKTFAMGVKDYSKRFEVWKYAFMLQIFELIASLFLLFYGMDALSNAGVGAIAYPLMVCSCLICFEVISIAILREKKTILQVIALLLCLAGVVLLFY